MPCLLSAYITQVNVGGHKLVISIYNITASQENDCVNNKQWDFFSFLSESLHRPATKEEGVTGLLAKYILALPWSLIDKDDWYGNICC